MMAGALELVTGPSAEPVLPSEAKLHARIDLTTEDDLVHDWISAAREYTEIHTGRKWASQTWKWTLRGWPCGTYQWTGMYAIPFPFEPVSSVTTVKYYDAAGVQQTMSVGTDYQLWLSHSPPLIAPAPNEIWPTLQTDRIDPIEIVFVAGYSDVQRPKRVKQAIYEILTYWSENRGDGTDPTKMGIPASAKRLLDSMWTGAY